MSETPTFRLCVLRGPRIEAKGTDASFAPRPMLAALALSVALGEDSESDLHHIAGVLWPTIPAKDALSHLRKAVSEYNRSSKRAGIDLKIIKIGNLYKFDSKVTLDQNEYLECLGETPASTVTAARAISRGIDFPSSFLDKNTVFADWLSACELPLLSKARSAVLRLVASDPRTSGVREALEALIDKFGVDEELESALCEVLIAHGQAQEAAVRALRTISTIRMEEGEEPGRDLIIALHRANRVISGVTSSTPRLLVSPLKALSNDPFFYWLGEGLAYEISDSLSDSEDVIVVRMGAPRVDLIVEGDLRPSGDGLLIGLALIASDTRELKWSKRVQVRTDPSRSDLDAAILDSLRVALSGEAATRAEAAQTCDLIASFAELNELHSKFGYSQSMQHPYSKFRANLATDPGGASAWLLNVNIAEGMEIRGLRSRSFDPTSERRRSIEIAYALAPFNGRALIEKGDMCFAEGNEIAADKFYAKAAVASDGGPDFRRLLPKYLVGAVGDEIGARRALAQAKLLFPENDPWMLSNEARASLVLGDFEVALSAGLAAPPSPLHDLCVALAAFCLGENAVALNARRRALAKAPEQSLVILLNGRFFRPYSRRSPVISLLQTAAQSLDASG